MEYNHSENCLCGNSSCRQRDRPFQCLLVGSTAYGIPSLLLPFSSVLRVFIEIIEKVFLTPQAKLPMKVIQKKDIANHFFPGEEVDYLRLSRLNKAITDFYLPRWGVSPLKSFLLKRLRTLKNLYLYLNVTCEPDGKTVSFLRLCFALLDDWEREDERLGRITLNNEVIDECLVEYFKSIGYDKTVCVTEEEIVVFLQRLTKDISVVAEYFEFSDPEMNDKTL